MVFTCGRSNFISVINEILKKVFSYPLDAKKEKTRVLSIQVVKKLENTKRGENNRSKAKQVEMKRIPGNQTLFVSRLG